MSLPVFLQLCKVLNALFGHPAFVDLILVVPNCTTHLAEVEPNLKYKECRLYLQRIHILHVLNSGDKIWELCN